MALGACIRIDLGRPQLICWPYSVFAASPKDMGICKTLKSVRKMIHVSNPMRIINMAHYPHFEVHSL